MSDTESPTRAVSDRRRRIKNAPLRIPQISATAAAALKAAASAIGRNTNITYLRGAGNEIFAFVKCPADKKTAVVKALGAKGVKFPTRATSVRAGEAMVSMVAAKEGFSINVIETKEASYWKPSNPNAADYPVALIVNPDGTSRFNRSMFYRKGWESFSKARLDVLVNDHVTISVSWSMELNRFGFNITLMQQNGVVRSMTAERNVSGGMTHEQVQRELNAALLWVLQQAPDHVRDLIHFMRDAEEET